MSPLDFICHFYPDDNPLRRLLIIHSQKVYDKAMDILIHARCIDPVPFAAIDEDLVYWGAMLHDIGIGRTHAPSIFCEGTEPYICHGTIGAEMLREIGPTVNGQQTTVDTTALARICERHTGAGLTVADIEQQNLPITPARDLLPETLEERLICLADKFYSKSGDPTAEKSIDRVQRSMMKFGTDSMTRFDALCKTFFVK